MKALLFDLDNTLVECGQYYLDAQDQFVAAVHRRTALDKDLIFKILGAIDVTCCSLPDGFSRSRFPRSFQAASLALDSIAGLPPSMSFAQQMYETGDAVFSAPYPMYEGVPELLDALLSAKWKLIMVTKGEPEVQHRKVRINKLGSFFHYDDIYPVLNKNEALFTKLAKDYNLDVRNSWMIGDSLKDDIGPAKAAGFNTVFVSSKTGRWAYEDQCHVPDLTVYSVTELLQYQGFFQNGSSNFTGRAPDTSASRTALIA